MYFLYSLYLELLCSFKIISITLLLSFLYFLFIFHSFHFSLLCFLEDILCVFHYLSVLLIIFSFFHFYYNVLISEITPRIIFLISSPSCILVIDTKSFFRTRCINSEFYIKSVCFFKNFFFLYIVSFLQAGFSACYYFFSLSHSFFVFILLLPFFFTYLLITI